jgi:hypothetical protein
VALPENSASKLLMYWPLDSPQSQNFISNEREKTDLQLLQNNSFMVEKSVKKVEISKKIILEY